MQIKLESVRNAVLVQKQTLVRFLVTLGLAFLVSRVRVTGGMMPFGVSLLAASFFCRKSVNIGAVFLGCILGVFVFWQENSAAHLVLLACVFGLLCALQASKIKKNNLSAVIIVGAGYALTIALFHTGLLFDALMWLLEAVLSIVMIFVFSSAYRVRLGPKNRRVLLDEEIVSVAFVCLIVVLGLSDLVVFGVYIRNIAAVLISLIAAWTGGCAVGSATGLLLGFGIMLTGGEPLVMANLAMGACVAGLMNKFPRFVCGVVFILINAIVTLYINGSSTVILPLADSILGICAFLVLPKRFFQFVGAYIDANINRMRTQKMNMERFSELTVGRLKEVSTVFLNASQVFANAENKKDDFAFVLRSVRERLCRSCTMHSACWRDGEQMQSELRRAAHAYEEAGYCRVSDSWARRCIKEHELEGCLNDIFYLYLTNRKVMQRIGDSRSVVGEQLRGVSKVISALSHEFELDICFKNDLERQLRYRLETAGIFGTQVSVETVGEKYYATVITNGCGGKKLCAGKIKEIVCAVLGRKMELMPGLCQIGERQCTLRFVPKRRFMVSAHAVSVQKDGNPVCGDSFLTMDLKDGRFMLLLCDGMGSGKKAREQSEAAVTLTKNFYNAGFDDATIINSINKLLMLSSADDSYSTMDLCMIERNTGQAVFTKIGAPRSYILRGGQAIEIRDGALPIGILENVKPSVTSVQLQDGDLIVLYSDGISDLAVDLKQFVKSCACFENEKSAATEMVRSAIELSGGRAHDDITVIAARVRAV